MNNVFKIISLLLLIIQSSAFCPDQCICKDDNLETTCIKTDLEVNTYVHISYTVYLFKLISGDANDSKPKHENIDTKVQQLSLSGCKF